MDHFNLSAPPVASRSPRPPRRYISLSVSFVPECSSRASISRALQQRRRDIEQPFTFVVPLMISRKLGRSEWCAAPLPPSLPASIVIRYKLTGRSFSTLASGSLSEQSTVMTHFSCSFFFEIKQKRIKGAGERDER